MAVYTFKSNQTKSSTDAWTISSTVQQAFTRAYETVDPDGDTVASGRPRRDKEALIAAVPAEYEHVFSAGGILFCSGVDADGSTEVMVYSDSFSASSITPGPLWVFRGGTITGTPPFGSGEATVWNMQYRYADSLSAAVGLTDFFDLLLDPQVVGNKGMDIRSIVVFHGAIVAGGPVWICTEDATDPPKYEILGWGFAISDSLQTAWTLLWDDSDAPTVNIQRFKRRGQVWCVRAAPVYQRYPVTTPARCAIVSSDYINKSVGSGDPEAQSGRGYYFHIVRDTDGDEPGPWDIQRDPSSDASLVKPFDVSITVMGAINHVHCAMATEWAGEEEESQGVQMLMATGDGKGHARFIHATLDDIESDYSIDGNWTVTDNFHGHAEATTHPPDPESTTSPQPVCAAFAPVEGVMFWGADLGTETLFATRLPADATELQQARLDHMYGLGTSVGTTWATGSVFNLTQPRPELTGGEHPNPIVACYMEAEALAGQDRDADRVLYCPDSSEPDLWAQCGRLHGSTSNQNAAKYGDYIYLGAFNYGLKRIPLPKFTNHTLIRRRPILVGCGGRNLVQSGCTSAAEDGTLANISKSSGLWVDATVSPSVTLPPVASLGDRAIKVTTQNDDDSGFAARVRPSSSSGTSYNNLPGSAGWVSAEQVRRFRGWLIDGSYDKARPVPNKQAQLGLRLSDDVSNHADACPIRYSCSNRWCPLTHISVLALNTLTGGMTLRLYARDTGNDTDVDENYYYLLIDTALDGSGALPYPLAPQGATLVDAPDELLTLSNFSLATSHDWHLKLVGMMPTGNWDRFAERQSTTIPVVSDRRWPLCTLWANSSNWIALIASSEDKTLWVAVSIAGTVNNYEVGADVNNVGHIAWTSDSPVMIAVGYDATADKLYIGLSVGGDIVQVFPSGIPFNPSLTFTELRFRGPTGGFSSAGEVCEFRWFGGLIDTSKPLTNDDMPTAFADLSFLEG